MPEQIPTFREFCVDQVERLSIYRRFDFLEAAGRKELRNWLERRGPDSSGLRAEISRLIDAAAGLDELPTLAELGRIWLEQHPPTVTASEACEYCHGTGFEIVTRGGIEGAKRCRCGGVSFADPNRVYTSPTLAEVLG